MASLSAGCRSGGWNMPGSSWLSWNKKKPPVSSIAGTRDPIQPPSVSVPPYPASESPSGSPATSALASAATSTSTNNDPASAQAAGMPAGGRSDYGVQPVAGTTGYATGPYSTGNAGALPPAPETQQGFYATSPPPAGPVASTADARGGYSPAMSPSWGAGPTGPTTPPPTGSANFAPVTTPDMGYGPTGPYPSTDYPAFAGNNAYPPVQAPAGSVAPAYPATSPGPSGVYGSYPPPTASVPNSYVAPPVPLGPSGYNGAAPAYTASSQYGGYAGTATPSYDPGTAPTNSTSSGTTSGYRPGSTSRNSNLLGPASATSGDVPFSSGTYYNR